MTVYICTTCEDTPAHVEGMREAVGVFARRLLGDRGYAVTWHLLDESDDSMRTVWQARIAVPRCDGKSGLWDIIIHGLDHPDDERLDVPNGYVAGKV